MKTLSPTPKFLVETTPPGGRTPWSAAGALPGPHKPATRPAPATP
jgi:hypothetical protein